MNKFTNLDTDARSELVQARLSLRIVKALSELESLQARHDINERLRFAREQALARARQSRRAAAAPALVQVGGGSAALTHPADGDNTPWWLRLSSLLPLAVLVAGLFMIDQHYTRAQIEAAAEVDAAILADELPPDAYSDPGFVEFLRVDRR